MLMKQILQEAKIMVIFLNWGFLDFACVDF